MIVKGRMVLQSNAKPPILVKMECESTGHEAYNLMWYILHPTFREANDNRILAAKSNIEKGAFLEVEKSTLGLAPSFCIFDTLNILSTESFKFFWRDATVFLKYR